MTTLKPMHHSKFNLLASLLALRLLTCGVNSGWAATPSLVTLVNPLQGTDSTRDFSHGNEYPAICLPFPMNT